MVKVKKFLGEGTLLVSDEAAEYLHQLHCRMIELEKTITVERELLKAQTIRLAEIEIKGNKK